MLEDAGKETVVWIKNILGFDSVMKNWVRDIVKEIQSNLPKTNEGIIGILNASRDEHLIENVSRAFDDLSKVFINMPSKKMVITAVITIIITITGLGVVSYFQTKKSLKLQEESAIRQEKLLEAILEGLNKLGNN